MNSSTSTRTLARLHKFIYRYSRLGRVDLIKARVAQQEITSEELHQASSLIPHGESAIVIAARNGHISLVKYLIEEAKVDVEQRGTVQFEGKSHLMLITVGFLCFKNISV